MRSAFRAGCDWDRNSFVPRSGLSLSGVKESPERGEEEQDEI
jgi:hypothetical protein